MRFVPPVLAALLIAGCVSAPPSFPTEVTRYRADTVTAGTVRVQPDQGVADGADYQVYARAVSDALTTRGYTVMPAGADATFVARIGYRNDTRTVEGPAPFTLGLGVGTGSYGRGGGVDVGAGGGIPIGKRPLREDTNATLSVRINTRIGDLGVWEGRAQTRMIRPLGTGSPDAIATKLATAMFTGFPGESGRTITVK